MTIEEARSVSAIFYDADGGCYHCVGGLHAAAQKEFPEIDWRQFLLDWANALRVYDVYLGKT